jgi:hypothetical protein
MLQNTNPPQINRKNIKYKKQKPSQGGLFAKYNWTLVGIATAGV